jgi:hypothetical protein
MIYYLLVEEMDSFVASENLDCINAMEMIGYTQGHKYTLQHVIYMYL